MDAAAAPSAQKDASVVAWVALGVFSVVTLFALVDRAVLGLLAEQVKGSLSLSDTQVGLLYGAGLALFAAIAYYPIGWLADRFDRRIVMVSGIALWSLAVAGCGLSYDFSTLFLFTALVGIGEAAIAPVFYSMIPELFRGEKRQIANSIFGVAAASFGGIALMIAGLLPQIAETLRPHLPAGFAQAETWRLSYFLAAAPAPLMVLLILLVPLGGPRQKRVEPQALSAPILPYLRKHARTMTLFISGVAVSVFGLQAVGGWFAIIMMRYFEQAPAQIGAGLGTAALVGTALGFLASLTVTRIWAKKMGPVLALRTQWLAYLSVAALTPFVLAAPSATWIYILAACTLTLQTTANLLAPTSVQNLAPGRIRGRFVAIFFMLQTFCVAASGPVVGLVSDQLQDVPRGLILAVVCIGVSFLICGALLLWRCERSFAQTVADSQRTDEEDALAAARAS